MAQAQRQISKAPVSPGFVTTGVILTILFIYSVVVSCVIVPWLSFSVPGALNLFFLTANTALTLGCYAACCIVDPGRVPSGWAPETESAAPVREVKRKGGEARYCQKCKAFKPPRAHHCRVCQRCVLRMDHHCPWMANCIGHSNYRAFILFLVYCNAAILHALGLLLCHTMYSLVMHQTSRGSLIRTGPQSLVLGAADARPASASRARFVWAALQTVCTVCTMPLAVGLFMLLIWNLWLLITNKTTIEYHEGVTAQIQAISTGQGYQHPYDLGIANNLADILGHNPMGWLLPGLTAKGNGLAFTTVWDQSRFDADFLGL